MEIESSTYHDLTLGVTARLGSLRTGARDVMKSFGDLGRFALADGALDKKTKELMALALGIAAHCDPCIGYHMQTLVKLGVTRQELDETLGVAVYMGGGPSLMYAANAIAAFEEFSASATGLPSQA
ncbi:MAG: carboxymuconolactone decarboxylase family protein [Ramlibacter sp.]|nr:carboxymuconolactone decarboxylase family protein [Ramlibacter sp.]